MELKYWNLWEGHEIEGLDDLGILTLFVRDASYEEICEQLKNHTRVWFCEEFKNYDMMYELYMQYPDVKFVKALYFDEYSTLPTAIKQYLQLYLKIEVDLKPNDHIGIGKDFEQVFFKLKDGKTINKTLYLQDKRFK